MLTTPPWVFGLVVAPGMALALVGLLGLGRRPPTPALARIAAGVVVVGSLAALANAVTDLINSYVSGISTPLAPLFYLVVVVGTILGFLLVGVASLRARDHPRGIGLLLGPAVVYVVMLATGLAGYTPEWLTFLLSGLQGVAHVAVGLVLRTADEGTAGTEGAAEPTGT